MTENRDVNMAQVVSVSFEYLLQLRDILWLGLMKIQLKLQQSKLSSAHRECDLV